MKTFLVSLFAILFLQSSISVAFDHRPISRHVENDFSSQDQMAMAYRTDAALGSMVKLAVWKLRSIGKSKEANRIEDQWENTHKGSLTRYTQKLLGGAEDIGDYKPLSEWLANLYKELEKILGKVTMNLLHLDDINTANYTIPVVFAMTKVLGDVKIDAPEYKKHFVPFSGVVGYWSVWITCEVVTYGSGWFIICTPAGTASRYVMVNYVSPRFSDDWWKMFWNKTFILNLEH